MRCITQLVCLVVTVLYDTQIPIEKFWLVLELEVDMGRGKGQVQCKVVPMYKLYGHVLFGALCGALVQMQDATSLFVMA